MNREVPEVNVAGIDDAIEKATVEVTVNDEMSEKKGRFLRVSSHRK